MVDALKRSSRRASRQRSRISATRARDRRPRSARVAISPRCGDMLASVGVARVLTIGPACDQIRGSSTPVDNIYAAPVLLGDCEAALRGLDRSSRRTSRWLWLRARALAKRLESDLAIIDKRRPEGERHPEVMNVIGEVSGRTWRHHG